MDGMAVNGTRRRYSCPARFIRMGNSCYFMSAYMASWHEAHFKCRGMGAVLAAFEKRSENHNMRKYLMREELAPLARWIGGIYQWQKRYWMWGSTGLAVTYKAFSPRMVNRDWAFHCISMDPTLGYRWRPSGCMEVKHYICETQLRRHHDHLRNQTRTPGQSQGQSKGRAGAGGTRHQKGPRRRPVPDTSSGDKPVVLGSTGSPARGGIGVVVPARRRFQHHRFGSTAPASQRWPGTRTTPSWPPSSPPPPAHGETTVHRRPYGPHNRPYGYHPPPPPPQPQPGGVRPRGRPAGSGATAGATRHQAHRHGGSDSHADGPRHRPGAEPWRQPFQMPVELAEATVHSVYSPPTNSETNDISNEV